MTKLVIKFLNTFTHNQCNSVLYYAQNTQDQLQELNRTILELGARDILPQFMEAEEGFVAIKFTKQRSTYGYNPERDKTVIMTDKYTWMEGSNCSEGVENCNPIEKTGEKQLVTESYKRALESINDAIKNMQAIQDNTKNSSSEYREALESQVILEKTKLALIHNELVNKKKLAFGF